MKKDTITLLKFKRLQRRLGLSTWECVGLLEMLWIVTVQNRMQGDIGRDISNEDLATLLDYSGDADKLVQDLIDTGWIDEHPEHRLVIHDWHEHCPTYVKGALKRSGKDFCSFESKVASRDDKNANLDSTLDAEIDAKNESTYSSLFYPSLSKSIPSGCTEQSSEQQQVIQAEVVDPGQITARTPAGEEFKFPVTGQNGTEWTLTASKLSEYESSYPHLNVAQELTGAMQWLRDNPSRKKTAKGMTRFLNNWLNKATNQRGGRVVRPNMQDAITGFVNE